MTKYLWLAVLFIAFRVNAAEISEDYWDNCPGPACPSDFPENRIPYIVSGADVREKELIERERKLLYWEKMLLEQERGKGS